MRKDSAGHWQVWVASAHLTGAKRITSGSADSGWPVWAPNGKRIAFDSSRTDPNPRDSRHVNDIFVMNADGSGVKKLTDSRGASADAAWSPNGRTIAFDADRGKHPSRPAIYLMNADGRNLRQATRLPAGIASDLAPRFSPNGKWLVFTRYQGTSRTAKSALFVVRVDGSRLHRLTSFSIRAGDADWSPDGKRIVFEAYPNPASFGDVYAVGAKGGKPVDLTRNPVGQAGSADPVWSPEGSRILFLDNRRVNGTPRSGLATMKPTGGGRHFVSRTNVEAHQPDWQSVR